MRVRVMTLACLALFVTAASAGSALDPQSPIDWPPKAVAKQQKGAVPDFKEKNAICLDCHGDILEVKTKRKNVPNVHRLHLDSKKVAYEGKNRDCLTCHELVQPVDGKAKKKEGWFAKGDVYHPNWMQQPKGVWKKLIVRGGEDVDPVPVNTLRPESPYLYKPSLKRLVCQECHGPDSRIKTFYGAPEAGK